MLPEAAKVFPNYLKDNPADRALLEAITWWHERGDKRPIIPKVSIVIPAYNCAETIVATVNSIEQSLFFCEQCLQTALASEIIIVDDHSTDNSPSLINSLCYGGKRRFWLQTPCNAGAGPVRNLGADHARGDLLFFLDADDLFLKEHIFLCLNHLARLPWLHYTKSRIKIEEDIHPEWQEAIENSVPFNICLRKWCHHLIGGFPTGKAFQLLRCEDIVYRRLLAEFFLGHKIERETVHHFRYPGNALDRQIRKFTETPGRVSQETTLLEKELSALPEIKQIMEQEKNRLKKILQTWQENLDR